MVLLANSWKEPAVGCRLTWVATWFHIVYILCSSSLSNLSSFRTTAPASVQAKVLFSWKGSKDNHLSLVRGEVVQVLQQSDKWWSGELQGKVGWFPKTFVKILEPDTSQPEATPTPQAPPTPQAAPTAEDNVANVQYEAIYDYEGAEGDLAFQAGDIIEVRVHEMSLPNMWNLYFHLRLFPRILFWPDHPYRKTVPPYACT